ncbi:hypothetical protein A2971_03490 [Candidatus Gottesmanbacteria bacterium RIFCSPLOWO2_01_FULL_46_21]|uniref:Phosphatidic acid phosphatase type 2/haloperoxidase domain-containing protein n=1 Tax=Candidatus Gottesmanbacteria bacterium RIFCSPLOWO2_01_FULL_46_21 TaxID=1798393 RepID=A0A1F6AZ67_9BACT|nr:MAG: hypothetical protein A2971_03490 [Candidatus Gottesmanbacteria bacterium RIFCSPLOWO2_01_FULL_46_21]
MTRLAHLVSKIFEPMIVLSALIVVGTIHEGLSVQFLFFVFFVMIVPALILRIWYVKKKGIDWDIRDRKKRILPLFILLLLTTIDVLLVRFWHNAFLTDVFVLFFVWSVGYFLITLVWKISGHTSVITLASLLFITWYGGSVWPILLTIPAVVWARVVGKNHTLSQAIGGTLYSFGVYEIWQSILR